MLFAAELGCNSQNRPKAALQRQTEPYVPTLRLLGDYESFSSALAFC